MLEYPIEIMDSQAKYSYDVKILKEGGGQASNYVGSKFFNETTERNILVEKTIDGYPRLQDVVYVLSDDYEFELGDEILELIGNEYDNHENVFMVSFPDTKDGKPQLNRRAYEKLSSIHEGYGWFVKLYDQNISKNKLLISIDEENKIFKLDLEYCSLKKLITFESSPVVDEIDLPQNRIVFGAPGTGKSYILEEDRKEFFGNNYQRVTFHPDYSYSHFVGAYKPVSVIVEDDDGKEKEEITYKYVPGPFLDALVEAINMGEPYLLIIEEINRANVAAVFGDVFQLLDRKGGESEYDIKTGHDMRRYLDEHIDDEDFDTSRIRIPENMFIWASMNSADQGVFPMDTAFKRRWDFEYIGIDDNADGIENIEFELANGNVKWNELRRAINNKLSHDCKVNEDKLLGPYFISKDILESGDNDKIIDTIKSKVLMYLFEDVARQQHVRATLFEGGDYSRYSSICADFDRKGEEIFGENFIERYLNVE